ncbi:hypothetical protein KEM48_001142 [Puccinia striiformis f. sp. tritici PST-130]|nr:hypothetical protein KEM48_001142 [Puccinia striiformis f. sp. tritici PST-130]
MAIGELDKLAGLLIRIYGANDQLLLRFSQLAAIRFNGDILLFVPAILNPRLFNPIQFQSNSKSQRTLIRISNSEYKGYSLPYALRASLPAFSQDGILTLPHLLNPVRDCSLLASLMVILNWKASGLDSSKHRSSVLPPKTTKFFDPLGARPGSYTEATKPLQKGSDDRIHHCTTTEFLKICADLYAIHLALPVNNLCSVSLA